ncbi:phenylalanine tRNA synthetase, alpha subunit [Desulfamplus magnetovallimortis]|uniref:Phenylalanine--tRNA ligase alpha subunit n=1 Tax=Desulfamplus magnetovallimortis TaxID=1246637 RepID=A0A1W1H8Q2_9BACT|nr:phenylalanine--tRNA ligase subunit alpha [Desulfamplus magnetovallimortis]SLM28842.1 phenylalanine tRNA synthetase, alpha subunit [Desulfamplus magnetovallimortis]
MENNIQAIERSAFKDIEAVDSFEKLELLEIRYLGRKGLLTAFLRNIAQLPVEERPDAGKNANLLKNRLEKAFRELSKKLKSSRDLKGGGVDVTLPGRTFFRGSLHPVTKISREISDIFSRLGFEIAEGPEVETDYYNFEALNIPKYHPARDMQDTFYVAENIVLRTHTSPTQPRVMEKRKPPVRIVAPGKVYRCDSDLTHTPMFHQVEGLMVDRRVSFGDLKGTLTTFVHQLFDEEISLRFRPSFFPFTEPSAEVDIQCVMCRGKGCRVCSKTGWLEVLGSGMVHPAVFENVGYDTQIYSGFAFGMGIERLAMLKYGIDDLRKFFENDMRFLGQF